jgi:hypothetical protein
MKRKFPYITVGTVLAELAEENFKITRITYVRLEGSLNFPLGKRTIGGWRTYTRAQAEEIKQKIKDNYSFE